MPALDNAAGNEQIWPTLPSGDAYDTLHLWTQIVGKIRLATAPPMNHWWGSTLYVTARGLTTSAMPNGGRTFQMDFDFCENALHVVTSDGAARSIRLYPRSVADFYAEVRATLDGLDLAVEIYTRPSEVVDGIPFENDDVHGRYDADDVN